jgi:hypothetical protein
VGKKVAKSCSAYMKLEKDGRIDKCTAFSIEPKVLKWVSPVGNTEMST